MELSVEANAPGSLVREDDEMAKFSGVTLAAWRSRASCDLQVDIGVAATACAKIGIQEGTYPSAVEAADVLVLKLQDDGTKTQVRSWSESRSWVRPLIYKYVVLLDGATILAVTSVTDVP